MNFDLTQPCGNCPFKKDQSYLTKSRIRELEKNLIENDQAFICHKTKNKHYKNRQHCAGALIILEKLKSPNQGMRIAERVGIYNYRLLTKQETVFDTFDEMEAAHGE